MIVFLVAINHSASALPQKSPEDAHTRNHWSDSKDETTCYADTAESSQISSYAQVDRKTSWRWCSQENCSQEAVVTTKSADHEASSAAASA